MMARKPSSQHIFATAKEHLRMNAANSQARIITCMTDVAQDFPFAGRKQTEDIVQRSVRTRAQ
jgi:hypothetical protein